MAEQAKLKQEVDTGDWKLTLDQNLKVSIVTSCCLQLAMVRVDLHKGDLICWQMPNISSHRYHTKVDSKVR
jgi:hypothetical protein